MRRARIWSIAEEGRKGAEVSPFFARSEFSAFEVLSVFWPNLGFRMQFHIIINVAP